MLFRSPENCPGGGAGAAGMRGAVLCRPPRPLEVRFCVRAVGNRYAGYLLLADALKEDAKVAIDNLKALNIENIQILSGDKQSIVTNFAEKLGISKAYGDLLPEGKVNHLEELRQDEANRIAFVGDGMNDAPVLTLSHVGIAMGGLEIGRAHV